MWNKLKRPKVVVALAGICMVLVAVLVVVFWFPGYYFSSKSESIAQVNDLLVKLDKQQVDTAIEKMPVWGKYQQIIYAEQQLNRQNDLAAEVQQVADYGRAEIDTYLQKLKPYVEVLHNPSFLTLPEQIAFNDLKNYQDYIFELKTKLRAHIDTLPGIYFERDVDAELAEMTTQQKLGQLFSFALHDTSLTTAEASFLKDYFVGGVALFGNNVANQSQLAALTASIQAGSKKYPRFVAVDQEGGSVKRLKWDSTGSHKQIAALSAEAQCAQWQQRDAVLVASGLNWNLGIVADVTSNTGSFIYPRVFSSNFDQAAADVATAVRCSEKTMQTLKHWPGHGRTTVDTHTQLGKLSVASEADWLQTDNKTFAAGMVAHAETVMVGHLVMPWLTGDKPASLSTAAISYLRKQMDESGLIVTDDLMMLTRSGYTINEAVQQALLAGHDHLFVVNADIATQKSIMATANQLVTEEKLTTQDLDVRVRRILVQKNVLIKQMYMHLPQELVY